MQALLRQHTNLPDLLTGCLRHLDGQIAFEKESVATALRAHAKLSGMKLNTYMHLMRQVLSGLKVGGTTGGMMMSDDDSGDDDVR